MKKLNKHSINSLPDWAILKVWQDPMCPTYYIKRHDGDGFFGLDLDGDSLDGEQTVSGRGIAYWKNIKLLDDENEKNKVIELFEDIHDGHMYLDDDTDYYEHYEEGYDE